MRKRKRKIVPRIWAKSVLARDNYVCQMCGKKQQTCPTCGKKDTLVAHHILPKRYFPQYQDNLKNGITLCSKCHGKVPKDLDNVFKNVNVDLFFK